MPQRVGAIVACLSIAGAFSSAQLFRSGISAVVLDVIVTDELGRPIPDLTKDDFEVSEDGRPRSVISAAFVSLPADADQSPPPFPDVWMNRMPATRRIFTIVIDDLDTAPRDAPRARDVLRRFIAMMPDGDLAAVVYCGQQSGAQEFTSDKARLLATLNRFTGRRPEPSDEFGDTAERAAARAEQGMNVLRAFDTLIDVVQWLRGVEGRRKAVLFVTGAMPAAAIDLSKDSRIADDLRRITTAAMLANVAIYPVDARGLAEPDAGSADTTILAALAHDTGGVQTVNTNNLAAGLETMVRDSSVYYLVGYSQDAEGSAGRAPHRVIVRVRRAGAIVRSRQAYETRETAAPPKAASITRILGNPLPGGRLPIELQAAAFADAKGGGKVFAILEAAGDAVGFERSGTHHTASLTYAVIASDASGRVLARDSHVVKFNVSDVRRGQIGASRLRFIAVLDVKPGTHRIRAAVIDGSRGEHGVVAGDLDVPMYAKSRGAMSGILVASTSTRGPVRREDVRVFQTRLPAPPTTERTFDAGEAVEIYVEVYTAGVARGTLRVTASVLDTARRAVSEEQLTVETQSTGIAGRPCYPVRAALPLGRLSPGSYTLTLTARPADATDVTGQMTFRVR